MPNGPAGAMVNRDEHSVHNAGFICSGNSGRDGRRRPRQTEARMEAPTAEQAKGALKRGWLSAMQSTVSLGWVERPFVPRSKATPRSSGSASTTPRVHRTVPLAKQRREASRGRRAQGDRVRTDEGCGRNDRARGQLRDVLRKRARRDLERVLHDGTVSRLWRKCSTTPSASDMA